jgi:hypothetical protein
MNIASSMVSALLAAFSTFSCSIQQAASKPNKHYGMIFLRFLLPCTSAFCVCSVFSEAAISKATSQHAVKDNIFTAMPNSTLSNNIIGQSNPDSSQLAGSKVPSKWLYSNNKSVACRIKKWSSYSLETKIDFEFYNLANKKPVNFVYTLSAKDDEGKLIRFVNVYTDKQTDITRFNPPLKKGKTKTYNFLRKYISPSSLELKECRVARPGEDFWTINPEMKDYEGP